MLNRLVLVVSALAAVLAVGVGNARAAGGPYVAVDLGTLGVGSRGATAINDGGDVAGFATCYCGGNYNSDVFLWTKRDGMVDLGTLPGYYAMDSYPNAISNSGQIVGTSRDRYGSLSRAFSWTRTGGLTDIGGGEALAVNDSGQVVGYSNDGNMMVAFSWTPASGMTKLLLPGGAAYSAARAVNASGEVVGFSSTTGFTLHAFAWTAVGGLVDLGPLSAGYTMTLAYDVNDAGQVVGTAFGTSGGQHAFSWTPTGRMVDLGTLGGNTSVAQWVTNAGQVVGISSTADGGMHGFSWTAAGGMVDLGTLGGTVSQPFAVSESGQVVGDSDVRPGSERHAFSWTQSGGMVDLGALVDGTSYARAVNDVGQVVGGTGAGHAVLWTPSDTTPPSLNLPAAIVAEAASAAGASVTYTVTAVDEVDPTPTVVCTPASGSVFPLGTTAVRCTASDASGNSADGSFDVDVVDRTAPVLSLPNDVVVDATQPAGAVVRYSAGATDAVDPQPSVVCTPAPGSVFAAGVATVTCTAVDASGNTAEGAFTVTVRGAAAQLDRLAGAVPAVGPGKSLSAKLTEAQQLLAKSDAAGTCAVLRAFVNELRAQSEKSVPAPDAAALAAAAEQIRSVLGCGG